MHAEKHREMGQFILNTFIDYRKCFKRIWQEGLWAVLWMNDISDGLQ